MLLRSCVLFYLLTLALTLVGCAGPKVSQTPGPFSTAEPIRVQSDDIVAVLIGIAKQGDQGTLIEDPGWREYVIEIENLSTNTFIVENVKLLNQEGRYVDSASVYEHITAPPDVGVELAGDVAGTAAGVAAGQIIPYGGTIFSVISSAVSTTSVETKAHAKRVFMLRVLKNIELAPAGKVQGSAFLPNITSPKTLVLDYGRDGTTHRIEIPLSIQEP